MPNTQPAYLTPQLQTNQRKPAPVQVPLWRRSQVGYLVCLPLVGLALLGSFLEQQLGLHAYFSSAPLLLAVVLISLLWGTGPALLAILVSTLIFDYVYVPSLGSFDLHTWDGLLQVLPFILSGALIATITAQREAARRRALLAEQEVNTYADKLELDNRLQSAVLAQASQELNTTLRRMSEHVQVLEHHLPEQREQASHVNVNRHALEQLDAQTRRLQALDAALLSVGKAQMSEVGVQSVPYDLCDVCRTLLADPSLHQGRNIELEIPSLPVMMQIDREDLKQVLVNVMRHALKRSSPAGAVQVDVGQHTEHIRIQVHAVEADHAQVQEQALSGSRSLDPHPASRDENGLWFVISKTIIEWYNGRLWYTSSSDGKANTCTIELPPY